MQLNKPWIRFEPGTERSVPGSLGVYEIGDEHGEVLHVGYAGGRTRFGLRGAIAAHFSDAEPDQALRARARVFRYEVNQMYLTRWKELVARPR